MKDFRTYVAEAKKVNEYKLRLALNELTDSANVGKIKQYLEQYGLHGFKNPNKTIIQKICEFSQVISIDIPSGIYGDSGMASGDFVKAKHTLSMGYGKWGHYFNSGLESTGDLNILDIGFKPLKKTNNYVQLIE